MFQNIAHLLGQQQILATFGGGVIRISLRKKSAFFVKYFFFSKKGSFLRELHADPPTNPTSLSSGWGSACRSLGQGPILLEKNISEKIQFFFQLIQIIWKHNIKNIYFNAIVVWQMGFYFCFRTATNGSLQFF